MCQLALAPSMSNENIVQSPIYEDKATSTDDELLLSPQISITTFGDGSSGECHRDLANTAKLWGADLVGGVPRVPKRTKVHGSKSKHSLHHQESLSSNSDISVRPRHNISKLRRQKTSDSNESVHRTDRIRRTKVGDAYDIENRNRLKEKKLRKQWTTDSSDSGYSKGYSREKLRRQDTEESEGSQRKLIRELQRQPTTESTCSLRLTRQSSIRSGSDNQSLYLLRQSTIETYDDISTTDFSRPQSSISAPHASYSGITLFDLHQGTVDPEAARFTSPLDNYIYVPSGAGYEFPPSTSQCPDPPEPKLSISTTQSETPINSNLLPAASCSLINLSAIELDPTEVREIQKTLVSVGTEGSETLQQKQQSRQQALEIRRQEAKAARQLKESEALRQAKERVRRDRKKDELPKKVRWSIMATGFVLLLMSLILVGATLRMAPLIDEMGEYFHLLFFLTTLLMLVCL